MSSVYWIVHEIIHLLLHLKLDTSHSENSGKLCSQPGILPWLCLVWEYHVAFETIMPTHIARDRILGNLVTKSNKSMMAEVSDTTSSFSSS